MLNVMGEKHIVNKWTMKRSIFYFCITVLFFSCSEKNKDRLIHCQLEKQIEEYPDSSFFSQVNCMNYYNDNIYILDEKRGDIVALSSDLKNIKYITKHGEAPYETLFPVTFCIYNDTLYAVDFGTRSIKKYYDDIYCEDIVLSNANENRFSINDSLIYLSANSDSTSFLKIDKTNPKNQIAMGCVIQEKTPFKTIISNRKHILFDKNEGVFSVSECYPYIDKYSFSGDYITSYNISSIPIISEEIKKYKEKSDNDNSVYIYIRDAYLANGKIYILCSSSTQKNDYKVNTILELSIKNEMKLVSTYILPHDIYSSFCISDKYIYASQEGRKVAIEKIKLRNDTK